MTMLGVTRGLEYWRPSSPPNTNCPFFTQEITREHQVVEAQRLVLFLLLRARRPRPPSPAVTKTIEKYDRKEVGPKADGKVVQLMMAKRFPLPDERRF